MAKFRTWQHAVRRQGRLHHMCSIPAMLCPVPEDEALRPAERKGVLNRPQPQHPGRWGGARGAPPPPPRRTAAGGGGGGLRVAADGSLVPA